MTSVRIGYFEGFKSSKTLLLEADADGLRALAETFRSLAAGTLTAVVPLQRLGPYSHAEDLRALLTFLDVDHASLVGLSMGGGIAIEFALAHPSASDALILVDATVAGYQWVEGLPTAGARNQAAEAGISAAKLTWLQRPIFAPAYEHPEVARRLAEMVETYSGWHWINDNPVRGLNPQRSSNWKHCGFRRLSS